MTLIDIVTALDLDDRSGRNAGIEKAVPAVRAALIALLARIGPFSVADSEDWGEYYHPLQQRACQGLPITLNDEWEVKEIDTTLIVYDWTGLKNPDQRFAALYREWPNVYLIAYDYSQRTATITHAYSRKEQMRVALVKLRRALDDAKILKGELRV